jgi:hypothetical protein
MTTDPSTAELSAKFAQTRFEAAQGSDFLFHADRELRLTLRLYEVSARPAPAGYEQFSALFRGPGTPMLAQGTYRVVHPEFGELPLFIVPIAREADGVVYEACVVRRVPPAG